jgi:hypothetical protein
MDLRVIENRYICYTCILYVYHSVWTLWAKGLCVSETKEAAWELGVCNFPSRGISLLR